MTTEIPTPAARVVFIRTPKRLTAAQVSNALCSMPEDDPRWLALHQVIDEELSTALYDVTARRSDVRDYDSGRAAAISALKERLLTERKRPLELEKRAAPAERGARKGSL